LLFLLNTKTAKTAPLSLSQWPAPSALATTAPVVPVAPAVSPTVEEAPFSSGRAFELLSTVAASAPSFVIEPSSLSDSSSSFATTDLLPSAGAPTSFVNKPVTEAELLNIFPELFSEEALMMAVAMNDVCGGSGPAVPEQQESVPLFDFLATIDNAPMLEMQAPPPVIVKSTTLNRGSSTADSTSTMDSVEQEFATQQPYLVPPRYARSSASAAAAAATASAALLSNSNNGSYSDTRKQKRRKKVPVPDEKKDAAYYEYRRKNTERARMSRLRKKLREQGANTVAVDLDEQRNCLEVEQLALQCELSQLRQQVWTKYATKI